MVASSLDIAGGIVTSRLDELAAQVHKKAAVSMKNQGQFVEERDAEARRHDGGEKGCSAGKTSSGVWPLRPRALSRMGVSPQRAPGAERSEHALFPLRVPSYLLEDGPKGAPGRRFEQRASKRGGRHERLIDAIEVLNALSEATAMHRASETTNSTRLEGEEIARRQLAWRLGAGHVHLGCMKTALKELLKYPRHVGRPLRLGPL